MKSIKIFRLFSVSALLGIAMYPCAGEARRLTADESLHRMRESDGVMRKAAPVRSLVATELRAGEPVYYVFSSGNGYVITTADDELSPVLAIVDEGAYDKRTLNPAAADWLDMLADEIEYCYAHPEVMKQARTSLFDDFTREPIEPMISSRWNQDSPYNDKCPVYNGRRAVSGCVATAMAMAMKWHKYPDKGIGQYSYRFNGQVISYDYENALFDWNNMTDEYGSESTEEERNAVAELMLACGVSVDMHYTPDMSGAYSEMIPTALVKYFGYSDDAKFVMREFYTLSAWERLVYQKLKSDGPLLYNGRGLAGGHQFICDGYHTKGLFHFNWGWSGESDGYFRLSALNPGSLGIGGGAGGFNARQAIVTGMHAPVEGEAEPMPNIISAGTFRVNFNVPVPQWRFTASEGVYSIDHREVTVNLGLRLISEDGTVSYVAVDKETEFPPIPKSLNVKTVSRWDLDLAECQLAEGVYRATPAFRWNGSWADIPQQSGNASYVEVTVAADGSVKYKNIKDDAISDLEVTSFSNINDGKVNGKYEFNVKVTNHGTSKYSGFITAHVMDYDMANEICAFDVDLLVNGERSISFDVRQVLELEKGLYRIYFTDRNGEIISPLFDMLEGSMMESMEYAGEEVTLSVGESKSLKELNISYQPLDAAFPRFAYSFLEGGEHAEIDSDGMITGVSEGKSVVNVSTLDGSELETAVEVNVTVNVGVADLDMTYERPVDVYSVSGTQLHKAADKNVLTMLPRGVYIVRCGGKSFKIVR